MIDNLQTDGETVETVADFIFLGSKITADGDCSHEIKRCLLLGRKVMTDLDSIFKSRDITLPTKGHLVKAMVFPVIFPYYFWNSTFKWVYLSFSLLFSAIFKASSENHFAFFAFLFLGDDLDPCLLYNVTNLRP